MPIIQCARLTRERSKYNVSPTYPGIGSGQFERYAMSAPFRNVNPHQKRGLKPIPLLLIVDKPIMAPAAGNANSGATTNKSKTVFKTFSFVILIESKTFVDFRVTYTVPARAEMILIKS
jgi:hypothetical protein